MAIIKKTAKHSSKHSRKHSRIRNKNVSRSKSKAKSKSKNKTKRQNNRKYKYQQGSGEHMNFIPENLTERRAKRRRELLAKLQGRVQQNIQPIQYTMQPIQYTMPQPIQQPML